MSVVLVRGCLNWPRIRAASNVLLGCYTLHIRIYIRIAKPNTFECDFGNNTLINHSQKF